MAAARGLALLLARQAILMFLVVAEICRDAADSEKKKVLFGVVELNDPL